MLTETLRNTIELTRLHKPIGIYLLLWPTLWALWIAGQGQPHSLVLLVFIIGTVFIRSAGCVINDIADRHFDRHVKRTQHRPIANGNVTVRSAFILFVVLSALAFGLVMLMNGLTVALAVFGMLLIVIYPFCKRVTHVPQLVLGFAFAWGVPMAFAAQLDGLPFITWLVFLIAVIWIIMYDTFYAMADRDDDMHIGIKSTAILFGHYDRLVAALLQIIMLALLTLLGLLLRLNSYFYLGLIIAGMLFAYQQYLVRRRDRVKCLHAFLNNHWVGLSVFLGLFFSYLS